MRLVVNASLSPNCAKTLLANLSMLCTSGAQAQVTPAPTFLPASIVYDAASRITALRRLTSNAVDPSISLTGTNPVSFQSCINTLRQRVLNTVNGGSSGSTTRFVYDEAGRLIGEYDMNGKPVQETIWLNDLPVAVLK